MVESVIIGAESPITTMTMERDVALAAIGSDAIRGFKIEAISALGREGVDYRVVAVRNSAGYVVEVFIFER